MIKPQKKRYRYYWVEDMKALLYYCDNCSWVIISSDKLIEEYPEYCNIVGYYSNYYTGSFYIKFSFNRIIIKKNFRINIAKKIIRCLLNPSLVSSGEITSIGVLENTVYNKAIK